MAALGLSGSFSQHMPMSLVFPVIMVVSTLASLGFASAAGGRSRELDRDRDDYLAYLRRLDDELIESAARQRDRCLRRHPPVDALWAVVGSESMWACRPGDDDFGRVRVGSGDVLPDLRPVRGGEPAATELGDPVTELALDGLLRAHTVLGDMPVTVDVLGRTTSVDGAIADVRAFVRAVICQLAVAHSPAEVMVAAVVGAEALDQWDWLKWLPHNRHPERTDQSGPLPLFFSDLTGALRLERHRELVVVVDAASPESYRGQPGLAVIVVGTFEHADVQIHVDPGDIARGRTDLMSAAQALTCARRMTACPVAVPVPADTAWPALMGHPRLDRHDPAGLWHVERDLRIPIGVTDGGDVVELDIKEAAESGMGPHGLCIGATGSGKSELLKTVALGMIAGHSPESLNLILVDFKGGAAFLGLERCRHVAAVITNLGDEAHLVDRMQDALTGEITRRQQVLRAAGNLGGIADYRRARDRGQELPPLPTLLVIVDEFAELLSQQPEFADVFAAIGRLGRSLGIHLLLASQRLDEGRLRGLDSHLSYRICLKTLSASESRAVLGVVDAYELPQAPGSAYLKVGAADPVRFQAAFVSGPAAIGARQPLCRTASPTPFLAVPLDGESGRIPGTTTVLDVVLDAVAGHGTGAHPVWLAPLDHSPPLDSVLSRDTSADLTVPLGLADRVVEQRRVPMWVDLSGAAGNVAVVGAPQSGKSAALRTLALALAATHSPQRVQLYCLDFGGGGLGPLRHLPHVGSVAGRRDIEIALRTVAELTALVRRREGLFSRIGADSIAEYRRSRGNPGVVDEDPFGDVFLLVDGWAALRHEQEGLESAITALAAEGLSVGVHVILAASRWADLRPALRDQIGTRIELRLAEPLDSEIDRRGARNVPLDRPGRGLTPDGVPLTVALPRLDGRETSAGLADAATAAGTVLRARYPGMIAPAIKVLPAVVEYAAIAAEASAGTVVLGIDQDRFETVTLDFAEQPHLIIVGDRGSGKTAALRTLVGQLQGSNHLIIVDPRRTMVERRGVAHVTTTGRLAAVIDELLPALRQRIVDRGPGGETFLVVDDYDVVATSAGNPLAPLAEVLPHARDIGLHLVIARRSAGAARALYEPLLAAVRDSDAAALQLSVGTDEGPLLTARPRVLPPGRR